MAKIFPSLIAADLMNLRREMEILDPHCDGYHLDVMDNHFVPNLTWGAQFINAIASTTAKPLWVHLMVDDPTKWIEILTLTPHSTITFHVESAGQIRKNIERLKEKNIHPGLALNPQTPIETVFPFLDAIDSILVMSVEAGFSGQSFIPKTIEKLKPLVGHKQTNDLKFSIGMDGGITKNNIGDLAQKGVDWFAVASSIFSMPNHVKAIEELRSMITTQ